jgi:hypothetical protein
LTIIWPGTWDTASSGNPAARPGRSVIAKKQQHNTAGRRPDTAVISFRVLIIFCPPEEVENITVLFSKKQSSMCSIGQRIDQQEKGSINPLSLYTNRFLLSSIFTAATEDRLPGRRPRSDRHGHAAGSRAAGVSVETLVRHFFVDNRNSFWYFAILSFDHRQETAWKRR